MGIYERPLIGTIIKPSVGLSAKETGMLVSQLCAGGIDFIKDDELQANGPSCPFEDRVIEVMLAVNKAADKMGHKVMVAFNPLVKSMKCAGGMTLCTSRVELV